MFFILKQSTCEWGKKIALLVLLCIIVTATVQADCVILLHGLARTERSMRMLEDALDERGYYVVNYDYPSRRHTIEVLAPMVIEGAVTQCLDQDKIHFVTHSLGGVLVRYYLQDHTLPRLGRVVMLGPPNQGSEVVDQLGDFPGFHWLNGDAGLQLGTQDSNMPNQLGKATFDVGIIAGNRSVNWILSAMIPGPDDGKVAVLRTFVVGMRDHIVLSVTHPFMMNNGEVIQQVLHYLEHGRFSRHQSFKQEGSPAVISLGN